jgi:hypothetical protein
MSTFDAAAYAAQALQRGVRPAVILRLNGSSGSVAEFMLQQQLAQGVQPEVIIDVSQDALTLPDGGTIYISGSPTGSDQTAQVQAAIDSYVTVNGERRRRDVVLHGDVKVGNLLIADVEGGGSLLRGEISIRGVGGMQGTRLICITPDGPALRITSGKVHLANLTITGAAGLRSKTLGNATTGVGVKIDNLGQEPNASIPEISFTHVVVSNHPSHGFDLTATERLRLELVNVDTCGGTGFQSNGSISNIYAQTRAYYCGGPGYATSYLDVNSSYHSAASLECGGQYQMLLNGDDCTIIDADMEANLAAGTNYAAIFLGGDRCRVVGGLVSGFTNLGIHIAADDAWVEGVRFDNTAQGSPLPIGVFVEAYATNAFVSVGQTQMVTDRIVPVNPNTSATYRRNGLWKFGTFPT